MAKRSQSDSTQLDVMEQHAAERHDDRDVTGFAQDHGSEPSEDPANVSEAKEQEAEAKEDSESETVPSRVGETSGRPLGELQRNLLHMYRSQEMTDLSIRVGSAVFRCHRVVLSAMSGLFRRLLTEEPERRLVILQNEDPDVFRNVMEYIYVGQCAVEDNFGDFLNLVLKLDISSLLGKMESSLESMISPGNCIAILQSTANLTDQKLFGVATNYVITHFFDDDVTDQLGQLSLDQIIEMLDNDDLPAENEEMVVRRGLQWLKAKQIQNTDAGRLFQHFRLPLTSSEFMGREQEIILEAARGNETCRDVVTEAMTYLSNADRRHEFFSSRITFRKSNPNSEVLVVLGGYKFGGAKVTELLALDLQYRQWYSLAPIPSHPGKGMATAVYDNDIFVTGGTRDPQAFWRYLSSQNCWEQGPPMRNGRRNHSMEVMAGGAVCVIGGYGVEPEDAEWEEEPVLEVELLAPRDREWGGVMDLLLPISHAASCASADGSKIYLFGGRMSDGKPTDSLQCLDLKSRTCSLLSTSLPVACSGAGGLRLFSEFVLFTTNGEVMRFDTETAKLLRMDRVPHFKRRRFGVACHHDLLVVVLGEDGPQVFRDMVSMGLSQETPQLVPWGDFRPPVRSHFALAKVIVPKRFLGDAVY